MEQMGQRCRAPIPRVSYKLKCKILGFSEEKRDSTPEQDSRAKKRRSK